MARNHVYEGLDENFKDRRGSHRHMLGTQISPIQGFSASYFHVWHQILRRQLEKLSLVYQGFTKYISTKCGGSLHLPKLKHQTCNKSPIAQTLFLLERENEIHTNTNTAQSL